MFPMQTPSCGLVDACLNTYGRIDILHNNVGIPEVGGPEEISEANWDRLFDINVKSMYLTGRARLPHNVFCADIKHNLEKEIIENIAHDKNWTGGHPRMF